MSKLLDTRLEVYCILPCLVIIQAGFYARFLGRKWEIYSNFDEVVTCSTFHLGKQPSMCWYLVNNKNTEITDTVQSITLYSRYSV